MVPYKHLDIPNFEHISRKLERFVASVNVIKMGTFFNPFKAEEVLKWVPEITSVLRVLDITDFYSVAIIRALPSSIAPNFPHTDIMPLPDQQVALNWPVYNCKDTYTTFYELKPDQKPEHNKLINNMPYERVTYDQVVETHRIKIDRPTLIRYDVLHAVVNKTNSVRITASLRFKTNPWHLFEDE